MQIEKNIFKGNASNSNIEIGDKYYINTIDYHQLDVQINDLSNRKEKIIEHIQKYPDDESFKLDLLKVDKEFEDKLKEIKNFIDNVIKLAETFERIDIDTERLKLARKFFDEGKFAEARSILDAKDLLFEQEKLLEQKNSLRQKLIENNKNLKHNSDEFLIKAKLTALNFEIEDWFEKTKEYFEKSIRADRNTENLFEFGYFLIDNGHLQALSYYEDCLEIQKTKMNFNSSPITADILNNMGLIYITLFKFKDAEDALSKALKIKRKLAKFGSRYLPDVARTLNNIGISQINQEEFKKAELSFKEALKIRKELVTKSDAYLPDLADTLHYYGSLKMELNKFRQAKELYNDALQIREKLKIKKTLVYSTTYADTLISLGVLYHKKDIEKASEYYENALKIKRELAKLNPYLFQADIANILNNIANIRIDENKIAEAEQIYLETLRIKKEITNLEPQTFMLSLSITQINLAEFYQVSLVNQDLSLIYVNEAINNIFSIDELPQNAIKYLKGAFEIIQKWDYNVDEYIDENFDGNDKIKSISESIINQTKKL